MSRNVFRVLGLSAALVLAAVMVSADTDMSTSVAGPATLTPGEVATFTVTYTNNGPAATATAIPELYIPAGIPANVIDLTQEQFDAIQESVVVFDAQGNVVSTTDTLGNVPFLFLEDSYCEDLLFQVQANDPPDYATEINLDPGVSGSFTVDIPIPQTIKLGKVVITEPESLAQEWFRYPSNAGGNGTTLARATELNFLARGADCNLLAGDEGCVYLDDCFGDRLSTIEPVETEFVLVDDGGVNPDPLLGCGPLVNAAELAGKIAVVRRGVCTFAAKALFIQDTDAVGIFMANDGRCGNFPNSPDCVSGGMTAAADAPLIHIPIVQVSYADGEEIIAAIAGGTTVRGMMGAVASDAVMLETNVWLQTAVDTNPLNDYGRTVIPVEVVPTEFVSFIPAAAYAAGAQGAFFQTDLDLNNKGSEPATVTLLWLPRGADNSAPATSEAIVLNPGQSIQYENVLNTVFGLASDPPALGAIAMVADSADVIGMSRTYNVGGAIGNFGQGLPGIPSDKLIQYGETRRIIFMSENDDIRANVGCANGLNTPVHIDIAMYDGDGILRETKTMDLPPWSNKQLNRIFQAYAPVNGYVDVSTTTEGGAFYCYGSVLDNLTSDPTTVLPQVPSADFTFIPAAALAAGAQGAFFQTDVDLNNAGSTPVEYQFAWLPRGADNTTPTMSAPFTLAAGASVRYANVLNAVFGVDPNQVGALAVQATTPDLLVMSRTYNLLGDGNPLGFPAGATFGQELPGIPADMMIATGEKKRIIFMNENEDVRANVGCQNGVDAAVTVTIELFDAAGNSLETKFMALPPWSNKQLNQIFEAYSPVNGYVDIWTNTPDATIYCYGSVLDNINSDPTTVLPQ